MNFSLRAFLPLWILGLYLMPLFAKAGEGSVLLGKWYFKSIEVRDLNSGKTLLPEQTFFGQMQEREVPLEFKSDGKVISLHGGSVNEMHYELRGTQLMFRAIQQISITTDTGTQRQDQQGETVYSLKTGAGQLELSRTDGVLTEKYVLIRK